jgi:tetratricopeptide (TPR) repeat protein
VSIEEYQQVEEYFEASLTLASNNKNEEIEILHRFEKIYVELGDIDQAIQIFNEVHDLAKILAIQNLKVSFLQE